MDEAVLPASRLRIVVGVCGSIAAYKAPKLIRLARKSGHAVKVIATKAALNFIGQAALEAASGQRVGVELFADPAGVEHVASAHWADLIVVAPASADFIARLAAGRANDLLTATILSASVPVVLAPAMHSQMWTNPATVQNVATLRSRGVTVMTPDSGALTSGDSGIGRFPTPERILLEATSVASYAAVNDVCTDLCGKHFVVSAGGTKEPLDPVRYLGNYSSGRQGVQIACAAAARGARVTLVAANVSAEIEAQAAAAGAEIVHVITALELQTAVRQAATDAAAVVMVAAVADYRPAQVKPYKLKKSAVDGACNHTYTLELVENPDVLADLVADPPRKDGRTLVVGFAAETGDESADFMVHARVKAQRKGADFLVVNQVGAGLGFGDVDNSVTVLDAQGRVILECAGTKARIANAVVELCAQKLVQLA